MNIPRPPLPPRPGRAYSDSTRNGNTGYDTQPSTSSNGNQPLQYVLPRSNTTPVVPYVQEPPRPTVPNRPSNRPKSASGGPSLPPSLMPGAKRGQSTDEFRRPYESALFFEQHALYNGRRSTFSSERSYQRSESPPPLPPPPPKFKPPLPPKPKLRQHAASEPLPGTTEHGTESPSSMTSRHPPASAPATLSSTQTLRTLPDSPLSVEGQSCDEEDDLARALQLSITDQGGTQHIEEAEDEILARVLKESLASVAPTSPTPLFPEPIPSGSNTKSFSSEASIFPHTASFSSALLRPSQSPVTPVSPSPCSPVDQGVQAQCDESTSESDLAEMYEEMERKRRQMRMDEELARRLAEEDETESTLPSTSLTRPGHGLGTGTAQEQIPQSLREDSPGERRESIGTNSLVQKPEVQLPRYEDAVSRASSSSAPPTPIKSSLSYPGVIATSGLPASPRPIPPLVPHNTHPATVPSMNDRSRSISAQATVLTSVQSTYPVSNISTPPLALPSDRSNSVMPVHRAQSANAVLPRPTSNAAPSAALPQKMQESTSSFTESEESTDMTSPLEDYDTSVEVLGPRAPVSALDVQGRGPSGTTVSQPQIVEDELLMGVSFGFNAPSIGLKLTPMQGPLPNIIALPYGKFPPLHIQAPSWKHLLKLLARLSDSRIEPTVEAVAVNKEELKLRTVIQFIKVHHSSSEWRTILYLSIDVLVPPQTPNAFKYVNGDVSTLPFSYTMTPLPTLLRDGSDSPLAKWYSVPATPTTPYPTLPITLPNYALYLQAVLRDSRRAMNDSSSGLRRLAKTIDMIYPPIAEHMEGLGPEDPASDRRRVGNFFRRALGRGDRSAGQRGGNDESYEFITPFRIDDYN